MDKLIVAQAQNTLYLKRNEVVFMDFGPFVGLEFLNVSGGTVWLKWHDDCTPQIGGVTSTPLPVGTAYDRRSFPRSSRLKLGIIAEDDTTLVVNII